MKNFLLSKKFTAFISTPSVTESVTAYIHTATQISLIKNFQKQKNIFNKQGSVQGFSPSETCPTESFRRGLGEAHPSSFKSLLFIFILLIANLFFANNISGQTQTFNTSGPFLVPANVTSITVETRGGGGAGGGSTNAGSLTGRGGAGGGGGAYASAVITVTPGSTLNIIVAAQTPGTSGATGANGGHSTITGFETLIYAAGGTGGTANTAGGSPAGGAGGTIAASAGTTLIAGTVGGNGATATFPSSASSGAGGAGANSGGAGGASIPTGSANGNIGTAPGGGGSGSRTSQDAGNFTGGTGAAGRVVLTWTPVVCTTITASATKTDVQCFNTNTGQIIVSASGGTAPYTYSINNGSSYQSSNTFSNLGVGIYQVRVKDANGCESKLVQ